jgi:cytochrome c biogenesis protein CcmG/thiol:disulfide interchange protein DsbE
VKKLLIIITSVLLIASCSTSQPPQSQTLGSVPSCDQIDISNVSDKKLEMPCLDGSSVINYHSIKGPIIINVWGSWCEGCREEMPYLVDLYATETFKSGKIKLLGIDVEESTLEAGPNFIKSHSMTWPHLLDIDSKSKFVFGMGVPVTWFIDANGDVIYKHIGAYRAKKELYDQVEKYFKVKL